MKSFSFNVIWGKYIIGIAVNKEVSDLKIQIPLTSYYFWPHINGWQLIKNKLELIPWLLESDQIKILNGYTRIINLWQDSQGDLKNLNNKNLIEIQKKLNFTLVALKSN